MFTIQAIPNRRPAMGAVEINPSLIHVGGYHWLTLQTVLEPDGRQGKGKIFNKDPPEHALTDDVARPTTLELKVIYPLFFLVRQQTKQPFNALQWLVESTSPQMDNVTRQLQFSGVVWHGGNLQGSETQRQLVIGKRFEGADGEPTCATALVRQRNAVAQTRILIKYPLDDAFVVALA